MNGMRATALIGVPFFVLSLYGCGEPEELPNEVLSDTGTYRHFGTYTQLSLPFLDSDGVVHLRCYNLDDAELRGPVAARNPEWIGAVLFETNEFIPNGRMDRFSQAPEVILSTVTSNGLMRTPYSGSEDYCDLGTPFCLEGDRGGTGPNDHGLGGGPFGPPVLGLTYRSMSTADPFRPAAHFIEHFIENPGAINIRFDGAEYTTMTPSGVQLDTFIASCA